jgi:phage protein D
VSSTVTADFDVLVNGAQVPDAAVAGIAVDQDLDQPAMCLITLRDRAHEYANKYTLGVPVEVRVGGLTLTTTPLAVRTAIFKGELVGVEPNVTPGNSQVTLRAFDRFHRLTRGRKSKTYQDQSDQDIVGAIASQHGLSVEAGSTPTIEHPHVYQHNQTDLEFLIERARAIGFQVWCEDTKLFFAAPKLDSFSGLEFVLGTQSPAGPLRLTSFAAAASNAQVVKTVTVRGRNPETGREIVGQATAGARSPLGSVPAAATLGSLNPIDAFTVDQPIFSDEEANAIAKAKLEELAMTYLTADAVTQGNARVKPGIVIKVVINLEDVQDRFNGKYLVRGCTHRIENTSTSGSYTTTMRLRRDAERDG